jgi:RNA polymerase sigma-70 factor (ECF subfamily)
MTDDKRLLLKAKLGCKESMRTIYEMHKDPLLTLAHALLHDRDMAEDVVHDVFLSFVRALKGLHIHGSLKAYLSTSVCNRVRDLHRRRSIRSIEVDSLSPQTISLETPQTLMSQDELIIHLYQALEQLTLNQREVLLLRAKCGLTFKEIARHQGVSLNTVQGRYRYGIDKLQSLMNDKLVP